MAGSFITNYTNLTVKNSVSSNALVSLYTDKTFTLTSTADQIQKLIFSTINANFSTGQGLIVGGRATAPSSVEIASTAKVEIGGTQNYQTGGSLVVNGSLVSTGAQSFGSNSNLNLSGTITSSGSSLTLASGATLNYSNATRANFYGAINSAGSFVQTTTNDIGILIGGVSNINAGSN